MATRKKSKWVLTDSPWLWNGAPITDDVVAKAEGFVYLIEHIPSGKKYIGKKFFWQIRKVKGKTRRQRTESDWRSYWSSSDTIKDLIDAEGPANFRRTILSIHQTRGDTNYSEVKTQFVLNVLEREDFINDAIHRWRNLSKRVVEGRVINTVALVDAMR